VYAANSEKKQKVAEQFSEFCDILEGYGSDLPWFRRETVKKIEGRFFLHSPSTATTGNGLHVIKGHLSNGSKNFTCRDRDYGDRDWIRHEQFRNDFERSR
jgi:hypothetical protein